MAESTQKDRFYRYGTVFLCLLFSAAGAFVFFRWLYRPLLPFFVAFAAALILHRPAQRAAIKTRMPRIFWSALFVLLFAAALVLVGWFLLSSGIAALRTALSLLTDESSVLYETVSRVGQTVNRIGAALNRGSGGTGPAAEFLNTAQQAILSAAKDYAVSLSAKVPESVASFAASLPHALLFFAVTVVSSVYLVHDYRRVTSALLSLLPQRLRRGAVTVKHTARVVVVRYLRAYGLLFLLTLGELWAGLAILGIRPAVVPALLIAAVDILPVLGTGTVLLPWAVFCLFGGRLPLGIGLVVLYAAVTVIRQIAEPRIVGGAMGQPPILTLLLMYTGLELFGIAGLLLFPAAVNVASAALPSVFTRFGTAGKMASGTRRGNEKRKISGQP